MATHIAVCIPSGEMVHADFMLSVLRLVQQARGEFRVSMVNAKFSIVAEARNMCVRAAFDAKVEWLLFLDSDMTYPPDTIKRLMSHGQAIVGATYPRRMLPLGFIGNRRDGATFSLADKGLVEAARMPTGCLLIKASVFKKLKAPFFRCGYEEEHGRILSEDFWFSERVRELGFSLWCDMEISRQIEHLGTFRFTLREKQSR